MPDFYTYFGIKLNYVQLCDLAYKNKEGIVTILFDDLETYGHESNFVGTPNHYLYYKKNRNIIIYDNTIYLINSKSSNNQNNVVFDDHDLLDLLEWKADLIDHGRLPSDSKLMMFGSWD